MPTGYTAFIEDDDITTGREFLLLCSRNFGVAIDVRDEPLSVPTPTKFEPDPYYKKSYEDAIKEFEEAKTLTFDTAKLRMRSEYEKKIKRAREIATKMTEMNQRYQKVRREVESWIPPTDDHIGIKRFALEQIDMCVKQNNDMFEYYQKILNVPFDDSDEAVRTYMQDSITSCEDAARRAKERYEEEIQRANKKTEFMQSFLSSLDSLGIRKSKMGNKM